MSKENILLCGLPESGKTTFIAALWYLLFQKEISTELSLRALPESRAYLNMLSHKWSRFTPIDRTKIEEVREINLELVDESTGKEVELRVPDMSGETWESVWTSRTCASQAAGWAADATGVMLFLHADNIRQPIEIFTRNAMAGGTEAVVDASETTPWSSDNAPTQVVLVDILQALTAPPLGHKARELAVIISAWDKASDANVTPEKYVRTYLPLLHQFLFHSGSFTCVKIYGVSALGGDLMLLDEIARLKAEDMPSNRISVVEGNGDVHHDLTAPIKWLVDR